jgi:hypothetical protein
MYSIWIGQEEDPANRRKKERKKESTHHHEYFATTVAEATASARPWAAVCGKIWRCGYIAIT